MTRRKCTKSLKKYGFCAILAIVYAAKLSMPTSKAAFHKLLATVKSIIRAPDTEWDNEHPSNVGMLSVRNILMVLKHYKSLVVMRNVCQKNGTPQTFLTWLMRMQLRSKYIVIVGHHAMFVESKDGLHAWKVYDQCGIQTSHNMRELTKTGGYAAQHVRFLIRIL